MSVTPGRGVPSQERHDKFVAALHESYRWQVWLGQRWRAIGLDVVVPDLRVRPTFEQRHDYTDVADLWVQGRPIEVKAKSDRFTCPADFPRDHALLGSWKRWWSMPRKPTAIALVSKPTSAVIIALSSSEPHWGRREVYNSKLDVANLTITCPRSLLKPESALINLMLTIRAASPTTPAPHPPTL